MENTYEKLDEATLKVSKTETKTEEQTYTVAYLKEQIIGIQIQKENEMAQRDAETATFEALLAEAGKLGVKEEQSPVYEEDGVS